jgi:membrane protein
LDAFLLTPIKAFMQALSIKGIWEVLKEAVKGFSEDKVAKLGGSLAYFTIFSLGPLLIVVIFLSGLFLGQQAAEGTLFNQIRQLVGEGAASQLQEIIKNASISKQGTIAAIIGIVTLLIGATSVFAEIQDSINTIWDLKAKGKKGWLVMLKSRLMSFGIVASLGFLLLVSLAATAIVEGLGAGLTKMFPSVAVVAFYVINLLLTLGIASLLFAVIFKVLPDAKVRWRDVWAGAITTALLFMIGKFAISLYISKSNIGSTYGAAGSLVVLLVWVYYSSLILYFGAEFTKAYTEKFGKGIRPNDKAYATDATSGKETPDLRTKDNQ